ncbi:YdcF family protein [Chondrinema litorale]|uniref:YdcF family protein n=1 Tax=Chondrinema litorale TaxID=2994555 RepID=UPI002542CF96|nr:YdcF family protein [Chondrinema litorale]UZR99390.1 YdcF family protein [Chondrinema litorale]
MKKEVLVVLGSPNSPDGELSDISKSRLDYCKKVFTKGQLVLLTGGWGPQFNTSDKPHAFYGKEYLIKRGLLEEDFLEFALSKHTVDNAVKIKAILNEPKNTKLIIITSDYHGDRVKLIFNEILSDYEISYTCVKSNLDKAQFLALMQHEEKAINLIKQNGLYY